MVQELVLMRTSSDTGEQEDKNQSEGCCSEPHYDFALGLDIL